VHTKGIVPVNPKCAMGGRGVVGLCPRRMVRNTLSGWKKSLICTVLCCASVALCVGSTESRETVVKKPIGSRATVVIRQGRRIYLEMNGSSKPFTRDLVGPYLQVPAEWQKYVNGRVMCIPYQALNDVSRRSAIAVLFPDDYWSEQGWIHFVTFGPETGGGETLWSIAEWFTGNGTLYSKVRAYNNKRKNVLYKGEKIVVPKRLLTAAFARKTETPPYLGMTVEELTYKRDVRGDYAAYKLKRGETLYGDVVGKFTPFIDNEDVQQAVETIARRSDIRNPDRVDVGQEVRIPIDLLASQYRPYGDPVRTRYEEFERRVGVSVSRVHTRELDGVYVILDAGHGGRDPGKIGKFNTQEDDYAYDVMCRVKRLLEKKTRARVITTIEDSSCGYDPIDRDTLHRDTDEYLLTHPRYANTDAAFSVNLRWYLANSKYRELINKGVDPDKIVFTSFHADARYYTMRGTMIYYPSAYHCRGRFSKTSREYMKYAEVRERPVVEFSQRALLKAQQESKQLAEEIVGALRDKNVAIQKSQPVRGVVYRHGREYVPGVIRCNEVPKRVLIEMLNLNNTTDCVRIKSWKFRERVAEAYVGGLVNYFSS